MADWWEERKKQVEPVRGMVGNLLSGMSPEAKEQYLEDQERIGGPFLRTASEALVGMLEEPISPLGMAPAGIMRSQVYKTIRDAYPGLDKSAIANMLRRFSMETLDPIREIGVLSPERLKEVTRKDLEGVYFGAHGASSEIGPQLEKAVQRKRPINLNPPSMAALKGEPTIYLSSAARDPLKVLGHETSHRMEEQLGTKYSWDIPFEMNPQEATADAIGHLTSGRSRQSTIARLLNRFWLPEKTIYDAVSEAEMSLQRARSGTKPFHYETLPERKSIERQAEKIGGPRRKNPRRKE